MRKPIAPCMQCVERGVGCHGNCSRYRAYQAQYKIYNIAILEQKKMAACKAYHHKNIHLYYNTEERKCQVLI